MKQKLSKVERFFILNNQKFVLDSLSDGTSSDQNTKEKHNEIQSCIEKEDADR